VPSPAPRRRVMEPRPRPAALPGWFRKFLTVSERRTAKLGRLRRCGAAAEALCGERGCPRRHHVAGPRGGEQANGEHLQSECGAGRDRRCASWTWARAWAPAPWGWCGRSARRCLRPVRAPWPSTARSSCAVASVHDGATSSPAPSAYVP